MGSWSTEGESAAGIRVADSEAQNPASSKPLLGGGDRSSVDCSWDDDAPIDVPKVGEFAKSIVYGGLDAIVTSFALVASISGSKLSSGIRSSFQIAVLSVYQTSCFQSMHSSSSVCV